MKPKTDKFPFILRLSALLFLFFAFSVLVSQGKEKKSLYVYKILLKDVKDPNLEARFRSRLTEYYIQKHPEYSIMDDDSIWTLKQKVEKQRALGCDEETCVREISRGINADEVITGEIQQKKDRYVFSFKNTKKIEKSSNLEIKSVVQGEMFTYQSDYYVNEIAKALMNPLYKIDVKSAPLAEEEIGEINIPTLKSLSEIKLPEVKRENIDLIKRLKEFNLGGADTLAKEGRYDKAMDRIRDGLDGIDSLPPADKKASTGLREEFVKRLYYIGDKLFEDRFIKLETAHREEKNWTPDKEGFFSKLFIGKKAGFDLRFLEGSKGIEGWTELREDYYKEILAKERNPETVKKIEGFLKEYVNKKYVLLTRESETKGDELFAKESYLEAITEYDRALQILAEYKGDVVLDPSLPKRIEEKKQSSGKKYYVPLVTKLESEGDGFSQSGKFESAFTSYTSAVSSFREGRVFLDNKIEAKLVAKQLESGKKYYTGNVLQYETEADKLAKLNDFGSAISNYETGLREFASGRSYLDSDIKTRLKSKRDSAQKSYETANANSEMQFTYDASISEFETQWSNGNYIKVSDTLQTAKSKLESALQNSGTRKDLLDKINGLQASIPKKLEAEKQVLAQKEAKFQDAMKYGGDYGSQIAELRARREGIDGILKQIENKANCSNEGVFSSKCKIINTVKMQFVQIPRGEFMMGCSPEDSECGSDEKPRHKVKISQAFFLGTTEVTQGQWRSVMGNNPSFFSYCGDNCPVEQVSWNDAQDFIKKLCQKEGMSPCKYRLPTEAEWEYSARAGGFTTYYWGNRMDGAYAWYDGNSGGKTHEVGTRKPNAWGLYDMTGNVWEWVQDWYDSGYYGKGDVVDPRGASSGELRSLRGDSWNSFARFSRLSYRNPYNPDYRSNGYGFRLLLLP
jgi:formylglycine-generating enzyme required for sulfatase activity